MKKELQLDEIVNFETRENVDYVIDELLSYLGCIENIEILFDIEFSCGDSKFLSDLNDEELEKYDGDVDYVCLPRNSNTKKLLKGYQRFRLWHYEDGVCYDGRYYGQITKGKKINSISC
jgi:hypothetical protein